MAAPTTPPSNDKEWSIVFAERWVRGGSTFDTLVFGKPISHPILVLKDNKGRVVSEFDGAPYDNTQHDGFKPGFLNQVFKRTATLITPVGVDAPMKWALDNVGLGKYYPTLRIRFYNHASVYGVHDSEQTIARGTKRDIQRKWLKLLEGAHEISDMNLPFNRFGWGQGRYNCQTLIAHALHHADMEAKPQYAAKGWKRVYKPSF
ncbi:MAG: hypothetical protein KGQ41_07020 [Alphaproteobacteria bacterium]|nr:hypothetical protein [Alphaproteobacteria bacterium]